MTGHISLKYSLFSSLCNMYKRVEIQLLWKTNLLLPNYNLYLTKNNFIEEGFFFLVIIYECIHRNLINAILKRKFESQGTR